MKRTSAPSRIVPAACLALLLAVARGLGAESLVPAGATWKYLDTGVDPGTTWRGPGFDDTSWATGAAQLGFGDGDEVTVIRAGIVTAYFRKKCSVANPAMVSNLTLRVLRDDGAAVYLNGMEVFRNNLPPGPLSYSTLALTAIGGAEETTTFLAATLNASLLVAGENVIAVEIHQVNLTSSDLSFDLELLADGGATPPPELPVVVVQTLDNTAAEGTSDRGRFRLVRSGSTSDALQVTVSYGGTASNGVDYATLASIVEIPAGSPTADLEIVSLDDSLVEGTETVVLSLVEPPCVNQNPPGPGCYRVGAPSQASASILDNDVEPPPPVGTNTFTLIASNSVWKYLDTGTDPGTPWRAAGFDDSSWASGPGQLGYGDGDEATVVSFGPDPTSKFITTYFRRAFDVADASAVSNLVLHVLRDDGVVVYLNGTEVFRNNMPAGPISFNTLASSGVLDENAYLAASISTAPLVSGPNVVAAEVHQVNGTSSDVGFDLALLAEGGSQPPPPELPLVSVAAVDNTAAESGGDSGLFRLSRTGPTTESLFVVMSYGGTAINGADCFPLPFEVEIPAGSSSIDLPVEAIDDSEFEGTESLVLVLVEPPCAVNNPSAPGCYRVAAPGQALVNILDDESEPPPPPPGDVTLLLPHSVWNYLDNGTDQGTAWRVPGFDDRSWASGPGQLGYGDGDEATLVSFGPDTANKYITTYFRRAFDVGDVSALSNLVLQVLRDDGVAVYLNGVEVYRNNLPEGPVTFSTLAIIAAPDENDYLTVPISSAALVNGRNVVAAEVHQVNPASSDLGFDLALFAEGTVRPPPKPCGPVPSPRDQILPAIASDGTNFLVVWMDQRNPTWWDVYGARVSATGRVLDPGGIPICTNASYAAYPAVAFDGANYLVVWSDDRDNAMGNPRLEIYGARVSPGGVVLDPDGFQITHGEVAYVPTLAFNGTDYLVTAYAWEHNGVRQTTTLGVRVTPAGEVRDTEELVVSRNYSGEYLAVVASAGGDWLVVWNGNGSGVRGARVHADGTVFPARTLVNDGDTWIHGLAGIGSRYLLTTSVRRPLASDTFAMDVVGTWITAEGAPGNTFLIAANTNHAIGSYQQPTTYAQNHVTAAAAANGLDAQVVWEAGALYTNGGLFSFLSDIRTARVHADGSVSPVASVCAMPQDQGSAGIAFNGENFLAVWQDARTAPPDEYSPLGAFDIYGARLTGAGAVMETNGFIISAEFPDCDSDRDGVPDERDQCADTRPGSIVNAYGCSLAQLCPCDGPWRNHAEYVDCVIQHAWQFFRDGLISADQRRAIVRDAAQSDCGHLSPAREAMHVHLLPLSPEECQLGGLRLIVSFDPIGGCIVETSTDLVHWTVWRLLDAGDIGTEIECPHSPAEPSRFFRATARTP